jgi:hypothetical protein
MAPIPKLPRAASATAVLVLLAATAHAEGAVPRVDNPADPFHGVETVELAELWRRGDEQDDLFFGLVVQACAGPDGEIYLLDAQLNEVMVLSADGELLRTVGREGEGPGEFRRAGDLLLTPEGEIGVVQRMPGAIILLTPDGVPAGTVLPGDPTTGGRDFLSGAQPVAGGLVLSGSHNTPMEHGRLRRTFISLYGRDGRERVEYLGRDDAFDFNENRLREADGYFPGEGQWDVDGDGRVYVADARDDYLVTVFAPDGEPSLIIARAYASWPRSRETLDRLETRWRNGRRFRRFGTEQAFAAHEPDILRLACRDGELWVLPSRGVHAQPTGVLQTWDVFTAEGRFDRQVVLRAPGDGTRDRVILLDDGRVLVVSGFQDARDALDGTGDDDPETDLEYATPVEVIAYAIR